MYVLLRLDQKIAIPYIRIIHSRLTFDNDHSVFVISFHWTSKKEHTNVGTPPVDNGIMCKDNCYAM